MEYLKTVFDKPLTNKYTWKTEMKILNWREGSLGFWAHAVADPGGPGGMPPPLAAWKFFSPVY